jgi:hypothetical protein
MSELPVSAQIRLASYGYDVGPEILKRATNAEREQHIAARVDDLLQHGPSGVPAAENEIKTTSYRGTDSPLYLAESRIMLLQNRLSEAVALLDEGLRLATSYSNTARIVDLLALKSWILENSGRWMELGEPLTYLEDYATRLQRQLTVIQVWAHRLRLARIQSDQAAEEAAAAQLAPLLVAQPTEDLASIGALLIGVFERVAMIDPDVSKCAYELRRFVRSGAGPMDSVLAEWPYFPYVPIVPDYA